MKGFMSIGCNSPSGDTVARDRDYFSCTAVVGWIMELFGSRLATSVAAVVADITGWFVRSHKSWSTYMVDGLVPAMVYLDKATV